MRQQDSQRRLMAIPSPWFDQGSKDGSEALEVLPTSEEVAAVRTRCEIMYTEQVQIFAAHQSKNKRGDSYFAATVMKQGTLSDKLASTAIQIRDDPFFSLSQVRYLVSSAEKKGRREAQLAANHLVDLLVSGGLVPKTRVLVSLARRPVQGQSVYGNAKRLLLWYFEDQLKLLISDFVRALEDGSKDEMAYHKDSCLKMSYRLLCEVPEREKENLSIVISKAGDKVKRVASRVPYLLGMLVQQHTNMRAAVVAEVERFLYKPSTSDSARYYLMIFLTQVALMRGDSDLAKNLIQIYFAFLHKLVEQKTKDSDDEDDDDAREKKRKKMLRKKKKKRKSKMLAQTSGDKLLHLKAKASKLNSKMLTALLTGVSRAFPYLEKGQESMFDDHIATFFKIIYTTSFNKACHALSLLLKIQIARGEVSDRFYQALYFLLLHPEVRSSSKQALFLNVLYGAIRQDSSMTRVRAIVKRLLQVALHERSNFVCAALVVVSETMRLHDAVRDMISVPEVPEVPEMSAGVVSGDPELAEERARQLAVMQSVVAEEEHEAAELRGGPSNISSRNVYNPLKENPLRSNADNSCAWELLLLAEHNHPTVAIFAKQLLNLSPIQYDGDPLLDFSLASFLDRFAYKAPKKDAKRRPADHEIKYDKKGVSFAAVAATADSREFLNQRSVRPEEEFMLEHMKARQEHKKLAAQLLEGGVDDEGNVDSELLLEDDDVDDLDEIEMGDIEFGDDDDLDDLDEDEEDEEENDDEEDDKNDYLWADDGLAEAFERDDERAEKEEEEERHERKRGEKKKRK